MSSPRSVLAALSEAVQRRCCTPDQLMRAHLALTRRNARLADDAIAAILGGVRSTPEGDFRKWAEASTVLPLLLYNPLLLMPDGRRVSPDALAPDAPVIHETNGRIAHERDDLFEDMQVRHDYLTSWGFTVLHNAPRRLRTRGRDAIGEFERCYVRLRGAGLPPGVVLLRSASA